MGKYFKVYRDHFFKKKLFKKKDSSITKEEAYQILGLSEGAKKRNFTKLSKFNEKTTQILEVLIG